MTTSHPDSYVQQCIDEVGPDPRAVIVEAAMALRDQGFGSKSKKAREAFHRIGSAMVAINNNPLAFRGSLNPDGPEYPVR